jgi:energy-coupling factor transporter ATP-binding protein EcfA2
MNALSLGIAVAAAVSGALAAGYRWLMLNRTRQSRLRETARKLDDAQTSLARLTEQLSDVISKSPAPPATRTALTWPTELLDEGDVEVIERQAVAVSAKLERDFERNLREPVRGTHLRVSSIEFFADSTWQLDPSVNVLLGRNGYGKSLLLRMLAGMLQRDADATGALFGGGAAVPGRIEVGLSRGGTPGKLERDWQVFLRSSVGKVPLLAIPDARFGDRSNTVLSEPTATNLAFDGARHFLTHESYANAVDGFWSGIASEYLRGEKTFEIASFRLLETVMRNLTGRGVGFDHIEPVGRTGARIWVCTDGVAHPIELQRASQGTQSVLAIFGIVHQFLQDIAEATGRPSSDVLDQVAIVIIDEVDAHLHPVWQRRIRKLLTDTFPNVQFIVSAHSPLVVAGCRPGQVSVLRKTSEGQFCVEAWQRDFVGATTAELYDELFEVEARDEVFLLYASKESRGEAAYLERELDELSAKGRDAELTAGERRRLTDLKREIHLIYRVREIKASQVDEDQQILVLESQVARLKAESGDRPPETAS